MFAIVCAHFGRVAWKLKEKVDRSVLSLPDKPEVIEVLGSAPRRILWEMSPKRERVSEPFVYAVIDHVSQGGPMKHYCKSALVVSYDKQNRVPYHGYINHVKAAIVRVFEVLMMSYRDVLSGLIAPPNSTLGEIHGPPGGPDKSDLGDSSKNDPLSQSAIDAAKAAEAAEAKRKEKERKRAEAEAQRKAQGGGAQGGSEIDAAISSNIEALVPVGAGSGSSSSSSSGSGAPKVEGVSEPASPLQSDAEVEEVVEEVQVEETESEEDKKARKFAEDLKVIDELMKSNPDADWQAAYSAVVDIGSFMDRLSYLFDLVDDSPQAAEAMVLIKRIMINRWVDGVNQDLFRTFARGLFNYYRNSTDAKNIPEATERFIDTMRFKVLPGVLEASSGSRPFLDVLSIVQNSQSLEKSPKIAQTLGNFVTSYSDILSKIEQKTFKEQAQFETLVERLLKLGTVLDAEFTPVEDIVKQLKGLSVT